jgi:diamine N-acetyltransferase
VITGKHVRLRAMEKSDLPFYVRWFNDPEVICHLKIFQPLSLGQEEQWYADVLTKPVEEQPLCIEILQGDEWIFIGNLGFLAINQHDRSAELGIAIGEKQYWGQGYGTEALNLLVEHGFNTLNLNRIYLHVYETNPRAVRSYEKTGFSIEGRLRQARYLDGRYVDVIIMSILKDEWKKGLKNEGNK